MAFRDLREFIAKLEEIGELQRITAPVSAELEIAEITDRVCKGPAGQNKACLLYTSPSPRDRTRSRMPSSA